MLLQGGGQSAPILTLTVIPSLPLAPALILTLTPYQVDVGASEVCVQIRLRDGTYYSRTYAKQTLVAVAKAVSGRPTRTWDTPPDPVLASRSVPNLT